MRMRAIGLMALLAAVPATASAENAVLEWNRHAVQATVTAGQGPLPQVRSLSIVHVAVHDAVQAITGHADTYLPAAVPPGGASADAAAIAAAYHTLAALFPGQDFSNEFTNSLAARQLQVSDPGVAFGQAVAAAVVSLRQSDGASTAQFPYTATGAGQPGVWVGTSPTSAVLPGWGKLDPWVLKSGSQFRPDAPPSLTSGRYARDYHEVKLYGSNQGLPRTSGQSAIASFWLASPPAIFSPIARNVIASRQLDLSASARVLALMYIAGTDATIAVWDAKYTYNFWRPMEAIRGGDGDANESTAGDPTWVPFLGNPQHPEYPSGHTTVSGAIAFALTLLFGDDPGIPLVAGSPTNPGFERHWSTFSEAVDEVVDARIWSGFHYRTSDEVGARLGRQVARFVVQHGLRLRTHARSK